MKKIRLDSVLMIIAIVLIFGYIAYETYSVSHIDIKTEKAVISTVYDKIDAKALVIRDEETITKASSGITVPCVNDGDKVNVGGNVAMTFSSEQAATDYSKYAELQSRLKYYQNLQSQTFGQAGSVESINDEIDLDVDRYIRIAAQGDIEALSDAGDDINDGLLRRQMIIGENVDLRTIIQELRTKSEEYASSSKPDSFIKTDVSGVFSGYTDGFENILPYEDAEELTIEKVENAIKQIEMSEDKTTDYLGKLVTSYAWYMLCVVDADDVRELQDGRTVEAVLKDSDDTVLKLEIISGADVNIGQDKTLLVMKCSSMDSKLASLRCEDVEIRVKSYEGFKVPVQALHVNEKGEKGVYALVSSQVNFRKAEVIYSSDDYVMLNFDPDSTEGVRLYDKIIVQGKELEDGKVFR